MPPIIGFNPNRLKVQLKLAINRIKLAQQKKNVSSKLQRKEIATLLENNKVESARIRVEGIIHDDYYVEAMEVLELYCELLIARFGLLEQMKQCDPSIAEAVNTLLYASSRLDIKELLPIRDQFISKFGKEFVKNAVENVNDCVNERIVQKLIVDNPDSFLVERYLEEIAKSFNLDDLSIKLNNNNSKEKDEYTALPDLNEEFDDLMKRFEALKRK
nr:15143_t:CDS:2 [Entrophospora candida]